MQSLSGLSISSARIVSCDYAIESHRLCAIKHCCKFNLFITAQTRIRCSSCLVFAHEVFNYSCVKFIGHIPDIERDTYDIGCSTSIM